MTAEDRIQELLEEIMEAQCTPEQACATCPELLPEVRKRWNHLQCVEHQVGLFFPTSTRNADTDPVGGSEVTRLPQIDGYDVQSVLGRGGMGVVYRARHLKLNRTVALKMLLSGAYADLHELARFQREAEAVAGLNHPNIVQIHDVGELDGKPYFTMEFVEGQSLAEALAGMPQPARPTAEFVATLARAVQVAHEGGIIHRDLKPANVLLAMAGMPKIADFGLARRFESDADLTMSGARIGTPSYMAPEQAAGQTSLIGPSADIYALGAILYEMLTGRPPFRAETAIETQRQVVTEEPVSPSRLNPKVPRDLETICLKCLHKEPTRRYVTAAALADDLQRYLRGEPVLARRVSIFERARKWTNRHRALTTAMISSVLLAIFLLSAGWWMMLDQAVTTHAVQQDFQDVVRAEGRSSWPEARMALARANARLGDRQATALRDSLQQYERELNFVERLEAIRLDRLNPEIEGDKFVRAVGEYESAFGETAFFDMRQPPSVVAAKIRATSIAPAVVVALDDWACCARDKARRDELFEVARQVDGDEISSRMFDPELWTNREVLTKYVQDAPIDDRSVQLLIYMGERLRSLEGDPAPLFKRLQQAYPSDFHVNLMLALAVHKNGNPWEGMRFYQAAIAIRPTIAVPHSNLGAALTEVGRMEDALEQFGIAMRLEPKSYDYRFNYALALRRLERNEEAIRELRLIPEDAPRYAVAVALIGRCLVSLNRGEEANIESRRALALNPQIWEAHRALRDGLVQLNQLEEARTAWQQTIALQPPDHSTWDGYAELCMYLGHTDEYQRARGLLLSRFGGSTDPPMAERAGRACLFMPLSDDELQPAATLIDRALAADPIRYRGVMPYYRFAKSLAEYRAGRLDNARALLDSETLKVLGPAPILVFAMIHHRQGESEVARQALEAAVARFDWNPAKANNREAWMYHILRREADKMIPPGGPVSEAK
jgi:tetratricopeptide (TPR) repeat protein/tRNA A-37 threonylcarbamoyl transferase component Bud32